MGSGHHPHRTAALRPREGCDGGRAPVCQPRLSQATKSACSGEGVDHRTRCNTHGMSTRSVRTQATVAMMLALCLAGCASSGHSTTPTTSAPAPPSSAPPLTTVPPTQPTPAPATTVVPQSRTCAVSDLRISPTAAGGSAGAFHYQLVFLNTSASMCTLYGFPGVSFLDSRGHQIGPAAQEGPARGPPTGAAGARPKRLHGSERHGSRHPALRRTRPRVPDPRLPPGQPGAGTCNSPGRDAGLHLAQHPKLCGEHRRTDHSRAQPGLKPHDQACGLARRSPRSL